MTPPGPTRPTTSADAAPSTAPAASPASSDAAARLAELQRGTDGDTALAFFERLPPVTIDDMIGAWRGEGLATGHRLDGLLERFGWHGKRFVDAERVHPLVFDRPGGGTVDVRPVLVPLPLVFRFPRVFGTAGFARLFRAVTPLLRTTAPSARLRMIEHRGAVTAAMFYDDMPVCDVFRRVDADTRLGMMDARGMRRPFWFILRRE